MPWLVRGEFPARIQGLLYELIRAPENRMIGAAAKPAVFEITETKRDQRGFLEFQCISFFVGLVERSKLLVHLDDFQRALTQVVRLLGIQREDLIRRGSFRDDNADNTFGAQRPHGRQTMIAIGRPVACIALFAFSAHDNDRIEETPELGYHTL